MINDFPVSDYNFGKKRKNQKKENKQQIQNEKVNQIQEILPQFSKDQIVQALKNCNWHQDQATSQLITQETSYQENKINDYFDKIEKSASSYKEPENEFLIFPEFLEYEQNYQNQIEKELDQYNLSDSQIQKIMEECYENMNSYSDYNIFEVVSGNQNDIDNEFIIKIQGYIQSVIGNQCFQVNENNFEDDFPSLPQTKHQQQKKEEKRYYSEKDFFQENRVSQTNVKQQQQQQIPKNNLHQSQFSEKVSILFPRIPIEKIEFAFEQLGSYDQVVKFFKESYPQYYEQEKKTRKQNQEDRLQNNLYQNQAKKYSNLSCSQLLQEFQNKRRQIQDLYVLKSIFKTKQFNSVIEKTKADSEYNLKLNKIIKLQEESQDLYFAYLVKEGKYKKIDLHGFYQDEIFDILDRLSNLIQEQNKIERIKFRKVEIVVGKGIHSKNQKPVIVNTTKQFLDDYHIKYEHQDGKIIVNL